MAGTGSISASKPSPVGNNQYDVTITFSIAFDWGGWNQNGASYTIWCDGQSQSGTAKFSVGSGGGKWVWTTIAQKTFRITMPASGQGKTISFSAGINTGVNPGYIDAYGSASLPARTWQWTVSYNANGGSGAPGNQIKTKGQTLYLASATPWRDGHTFTHWTGNNNTYYPSGAYTSDANCTMYAQWSIHTYTIKYDANGGWSAPSPQTKNWGSTIQLSQSHPSRTNYNFKGWGTSPSSTSPSYWAGSNYSANASITLYAIWELAYTAPRIWGISADRCNKDGTYNEEGTYARVKFSWQSDKAFQGMTISCNNKDVYPGGSGTSGSVDQIIGQGTLSTENEYSISIVVRDAVGSSTRYTSIPPLSYIMDILHNGKGVAFGKPSTTAGYIDTVWKIKGVGHDGAWVSGRDNALLSQKTLPENAYCCLASVKTKNGSWDIGAYDDGSYTDKLVFTYINDSDYNTGNNTVESQVSFTKNGDVYTSSGWALSSGYNLRDAPLVGTWGKTFMFNGWGNGGDRYFLSVNSNGEVHSGTQLNSANSPTPRRLAFAIERINILWQGAYYMQEGQTAYLSEPISAQMYGVVLVFSFYSTSTGAKNEQFSYMYVPKHMAVNFPGVGSCHSYMSNWYAALKYVYIYDKQINGHAANVQNKNVNGLTVSGLNCVLRYVIGV